MPNKLNIEELAHQGHSREKISNHFHYDKKNFAKIARKIILILSKEERVYDNVFSI